jgi:hypothetical protein
MCADAHHVKGIAAHQLAKLRIGARSQCRRCWSCVRATASKEVFCQSNSDFVTRVRCRIYVYRGRRRAHNTLDVSRGWKEARK